mmetsp:Transcript_2126/g.3267  ORF Transcript_2126/g.3267 Transcript_2126/m.3267 type:complete len:542 (-) Transcript_2126:127-1752(-)
MLSDSATAPVGQAEDPLALPALPTLPTDILKTSHDNDEELKFAESHDTGAEKQATAKETTEDPGINAQQTAETVETSESVASVDTNLKTESASIELSGDKPIFLENLGDAHLVGTYQDGNTDVLDHLCVPKKPTDATHEWVDAQENSHAESKEDNRVGVEGGTAEDNNDNDSSPSDDGKGATDEPEETPKKRGPGRPRGSRSRKRAKPNDSIEDPSQDLSMIPKSVRYLKKIQGQNPALATAYSELEAAKQEREIVAKYVEEVLAEAEMLEAKLKKVHERLEQAKIRLQREEETVKRAADAVGEAELRVPCSWNNNYQKLVAYKEKHGHIKLPVRCPEDKELDSLCIWVAHQKARYKLYIHGEVKTKKPHRITALENLGIEWVVKGTMWQQKYDELLVFKERHGHCMVPTRTSKEYKDLGIWVGVQRTEYKNLKDGKTTQLTPDRIELLEKAGFIWNVTDLKWQEMYQKLVSFRGQEGHCNVPDRYPPDQPLANWVARQRKEYQLLCDQNVNNEVDEKGRTRRMRMTQERLKFLNDIGFQW